MNAFLHVLTDYGDFLCASGVAAVVAAWAWLYLSRLTATSFAFAYLLTVASALLLKLLSGQNALPVSLAPIFTFSDGAPSGHAALATVVYGSAALFFGQCGGWRGRLGQVACIAVIAVVSITRVTLQAHTIPDVLAGLALGGLAVLIPASTLKHGAADAEPMVGRLMVTMAAVAAILLISGARMPSTNFL